MIKTPALQGIVQLPSAVGGQDDMGAMPGFYGPNLRDRDLKIRENFQKKGFEFFVGAVNLIDEQNGRFGRIVLNGLQKGAADEKFRAEDSLGHRLPG